MEKPPTTGAPLPDVGEDRAVFPNDDRELLGVIILLDELPSDGEVMSVECRV